MDNSPFRAAEQVIQQLLQAKIRLEEQKYASLQDYFTVDEHGELKAKEVAVQMPIVTDQGIRYQTQQLPLASICPCQFFKLESLSLTFNAYLRCDKDDQNPHLTFAKKSGWFQKNHPVRVSMSFCEKEGAKVALIPSSTSS
ncbi:hypothetical protein AB2S62_18470 [Vibrio sp. NTOU-M3]|uniref:hypothetical protein n=1 Tax=Vibrio sp. NTOU-M3 TaxID=3234954 RepID=UPI00349F2F90